MERKHFLKTLLLGTASAPVLLAACGKAPEGMPAAGDATGTAGSCPLMPTETEGPFPTHMPSAYVRSNLADGRKGYALTVNLTVVSAARSCGALAGALVDIWHCDAEGNYSEYSGIVSALFEGMFKPAAGGTAVHFLRGRQVTDGSGTVSFTTLFPGWYSGRATHIHVHVYSATGTSLLVTQVAFPDGPGSAVRAVNGYAKGLRDYRYNAQDSIFRDDSTGAELATVTGNATSGFLLQKTLTVA